MAATTDTPTMALVGWPSLRLVQKPVLSRSLIVGLVESGYLEGSGWGGQGQVKRVHVI